MDEPAVQITDDSGMPLLALGCGASAGGSTGFVDRSSTGSPSCFAAISHRGGLHVRQRACGLALYLRIEANIAGCVRAHLASHMCHRIGSETFSKG